MIRFCPVDDLEDRTITVWSKDGVPPATPVNAPQTPPRWQGLIWGILPIGSSLLAILVLMIPDKGRRGRTADDAYKGEAYLVHERLTS